MHFCFLFNLSLDSFASLLHLPYIFYYIYMRLLMSHKSFNPLQFLSAVGAGGISVIPFAFLQYTYHTGKGLITVENTGLKDLPFFQSVLFAILMGVMVLFGTIHTVLSVKLFSRYSQWKKSDEYRMYRKDPHKNITLLTPFISLGMSFNVIIAVARFFIPLLYRNFQLLMAPALAGWLVLLTALVMTEAKILKKAFASPLKSESITFSWLLHPFALGMTTVIGTGLAALASSPVIAGIAAFFSFVTGSMGVLLFALFLTLGVLNLFKSESLPSKEAMPALLSAVPIVTLLSISGFRLVHYFEKQFDFHMHWAAVVLVLGGFAFQTWYLITGLHVMRDYFKNHYVQDGFHVSHWSLICPFVAYAVLGSFLYKVFIPNPLIYTLVLITGAFVTGLYGFTLFRQLGFKRADKENREINSRAA